MTNIEVPPDPERLIEGLRDTGYTFSTAVADIIDNSIAAQATNINVEIDMDLRGTISVSIADDGLGMTKEELIQGMKYGSPERPDPMSLGKFGLGLKTASTSFCRRLSVISRPMNPAEATKATWDLDHVAKVSKWELMVDEASEDELSLIDHVSESGRGTVVIWLNIDRLLKEYKEPGGKFAVTALSSKVGELREFLGMVYQRFLDTDDPREPHKIRITVSGKEVEAWDPFYEEYSEKIADEEWEFVEKGADNVIGTVKVRGYAIPHKDEYDNDEQWKYARISNANQGLYIYRQNRVIEHATWFGMYSKEPHFSLARIDFSFGAELDDPLGVDIKKSKIRLSSDAEDWLKEDFIVPVRRAAEQRYRQKVKVRIQEQATGADDESNKNIGGKVDRIDTPSINELDPEAGTAVVTNLHGQTGIEIEIRPMEERDVYVNPVESITDGLLWQPAIIGANLGVDINTSHDFYRKVYVPNMVSPGISGINIQGIDSLLWALSVAELRAVSEVTVQHFRDMRYEIAKILRTLVMDMPEPPELDE